MKITNNIDALLTDLSAFRPDTLSSISNFVRAHGSYNSILMLARNSDRSAKYLLDKCLGEKEGSIDDIGLAGLLVIVADIESDLYKDLMSRASDGIGDYHWSRAMATSYLIQHEVLGETICQSA